MRWRVLFGYCVLVGLLACGVVKAEEGGENLAFEEVKALFRESDTGEIDYAKLASKLFRENQRLREALQQTPPTGANVVGGKKKRKRKKGAKAQNSTWADNSDVVDLDMLDQSIAVPADLDQRQITPPLTKVTSEMLSNYPRLWVIEHFFSDAECDYLVEGSTPLLTKCTGRRCQEVPGNLYTTNNVILQKLLQRIFDMTWPGLHKDDGIQIVRYSVGDNFGWHNDHHGGKEDYIVGTVMIYLNDDTNLVGGETEFQRSKRRKKALKVTPKKGMAVVWWSCRPSGKVDRSAVHRGRKVKQGQKWIANVFLYARGAEKPCKLKPKIPQTITYAL